MAKSKIQQTIRKTVEGTLVLENTNVNIDIDDFGSLDFADVFKIFNGEYVKITVAVSNDEMVSEVNVFDEVGE